MLDDFTGVRGPALGALRAALVIPGARRRTGDLGAAALAAASAQRHGATFSLWANPINDDERFQVTAEINPGDRYTVANNEITVPEPGLYFVSWRIAAQVDNPANGAGINVRVRLGGTGIWVYAVHNRYSADITQRVQLSQSGVIPITTPASETVSLRNGLNVNLTATGSPAHANQLTLFRVGDLP